ncbi:MAG: OadG family protein [Sphaerochaetaceae bacterium]|jgi:Na+-transporting methylmalonyl-CoA/oxaloacetate decarboxylase gamma subunit|nr:OadG family protein [Sphaerochaetaceae bacterium]NLO59481.1 OadG family protein [Spirochaetales bacterium]
MMEVFGQSLTLMWQGMVAIFVVIFIIYLILSAFPKLFKNKEKKD